MNYLTIHVQHIASRVQVEEEKIERRKLSAQREGSTSKRIIDLMHHDLSYTTHDLALMVGRTDKDVSGMMSQLKRSNLVTRKKNVLGLNQWTKINGGISVSLRGCADTNSSAGDTVPSPI